MDERWLMANFKVAYQFVLAYSLTITLRSTSVISIGKRQLVDNELFLNRERRNIPGYAYFESFKYSQTIVIRIGSRSGYSGQFEYIEPSRSIWMA